MWRPIEHYKLDDTEQVLGNIAIDYQSFAVLTNWGFVEVTIPVDKWAVLDWQLEGQWQVLANVVHDITGQQHVCLVRQKHYKGDDDDLIRPRDGTYMLKLYREDWLQKWRNGGDPPPFASRA